jgi:DNA-binding transcriptional ArsR family regulator
MIQETLFALCDPTRREILKMLKKGSKTAGEIAERFDISPPAISRHLSVLKDAELVETRREGKFIVYESNFEPIEDLDDWIRELLKENL